MLLLSRSIWEGRVQSRGMASCMLPGNADPAAMGPQATDRPATDPAIKQNPLLPPPAGEACAHQRLSTEGAVSCCVRLRTTTARRPHCSATLLHDHAGALAQDRRPQVAAGAERCVAVSAPGWDPQPRSGPGAVCGRGSPLSRPHQVAEKQASEPESICCCAAQPLPPPASRGQGAPPPPTSRLPAWRADGLPGTLH